MQQLHKQSLLHGPNVDTPTIIIIITTTASACIPGETSEASQAH